MKPDNFTIILRAILVQGTEENTYPFYYTNTYIPPIIPNNYSVLKQKSSFKIHIYTVYMQLFTCMRAFKIMKSSFLTVKYRLVFLTFF